MRGIDLREAYLNVAQVRRAILSGANLDVGAPEAETPQPISADPAHTPVISRQVQTKSPQRSMLFIRRRGGFSGLHCVSCLAEHEGVTFPRRVGAWFYKNIFCNILSLSIVGFFLRTQKEQDVPEKTCPACQHDNESDAQYCAQCGTLLAGTGIDITQRGKTPIPGYSSSPTLSAERTRGTVPRASERRLQRTVAIVGGLLAAILLVLALFVGVQQGSKGSPTSTPASTSGKTGGQNSTAGNASSTSPSSTRVSTQPSATYPKLAIQYSGTSHDTMCVVGNSNGCACYYATGQPDANCDYTLTLTSVVQDQNKFSGNLTRNSLHGSGAFTGTITSDGKITFTVTSNNLDIGQVTDVYTGVLQSDHSMSGTWKGSGEIPQAGTWQLSPS